MDKWVAFYQDYFPSKRDAERFVEGCESLDGAANPKIMMHQAQRLVTLSREVAQVRPTGDGLQLLFLIICAENLAKMADRFEGEGQSRKYVRKFFSTYLSTDDQDQLINGFASHDISKEAF